MNIAEDIVSILKTEILQDEEFEISTDEDLLSSNTLDSMALIRLVASIEEKYEFKIPPTDLVIEHFINIDAMATYIGSKVSE